MTPPVTRSTGLVILAIVAVSLYFLNNKLSLSYYLGNSDGFVEVEWSKINRRPLPPVNEMHDKWIVITTINPPTKDVIKLSKIKGWKVVVVGDTKTPADWK